LRIEEMSSENDLVAKCPECGAVFRLTPQHLQAAKGWVQCGMCGHVFHSGIKPSVETAAEKSVTLAPESAAEITAEPISEKPAEPASVEVKATEAATVPADSVDAETKEAGAEAAAAGLSGLAHRMAEQEETQSAFGPKLESIIIVTPDTPVADDDYGPMPVFESNKPEEAKPEKATTQYTPATPPPGGWGARKTSATSTGWVPRRSTPQAPARPVKKSKLGWLWVLIVLALLLALAAQLTYYMRDKLAANFPEIRPVLAQLCDTLNCTLSLPRDNKQVLILGSDLQTENEGNLSLEVTLANRASYAMAWPVLELTLTDVEDQPLARRMFAPSEYLPSSKMETAGIQARTEVPFDLQLQSKGLKAAGYRLRMFY
jgi:predicted Zn finger-like uncharacterized protein